MRAPDFWRAKAGLSAALLSPLSSLYILAGRLRRHLSPIADAPVPVICVGNLVAGGAGKTPVVLALADRLTARGRRPHLLSRGYGGRARGPLLVEPERHDAAEVGDEALLLAAAAPTWVARDRVAGAKAAVAAGADVIVLDDGFQNPRLRYDLSLVVIDTDFGFGNGRVVPAGPLREPVADGLARADAVVLMGSGVHAAALAAAADDLPQIWARLGPLPGSESLAGERVVAFAGIGRPEKFFALLRDMGAELCAAYGFADHHRFSVDEIMLLVDEAHGRGARLLTTEKDLARLPIEARPMVEAVPVIVEFEDEALLQRLLAKALSDG